MKESAKVAVGLDPYCSICGQSHETTEDAGKCYRGHLAARTVCVAYPCAETAVTYVDGRGYCAECAGKRSRRGSPAPEPTLEPEPEPGPEEPQEESMARNSGKSVELVRTEVEPEPEPGSVEAGLELARKRIRDGDALFQHLDHITEISLDLQGVEGRIKKLNGQMAELMEEREAKRNAIRGMFLKALEEAE